VKLVEQTAFDVDEKNAGLAAARPSGRSDSSALTSIWRVNQDGSHRADDFLAVEDPLEIQIVFGPEGARQRKSITVTMRTPGWDEELAAGFLLTEGVLDDSSQILRIDTAESTVPNDAARTVSNFSSENTVRVELAPDVEVRMATLERNFYTTSSCGICGKASLLALRSVCPPRYSNHVFIDAEMLYALPQSLRDSQAVFDATGGLHGAALFTTEGRLILSREDVGRHNAVDKLLGHQFLSDAVPLRDQILMLSGRVSFELMQKAVMAGIPVVVAVGAPSSLAVKVAEDFDVTLVGFLRDQRFNIYHGRDRIRGLSSSEAMQ
jgi:FdhD protein